MDAATHCAATTISSVIFFMLPALLFFCCFIIIPMLTGFVTSLLVRRVDPVTNLRGLRNYAELFTTPTFYRALLNTLLIVVVRIHRHRVFAVGGFRHHADARGTAFVFSLCVLSARGHGHRGGRGRVEMDVRCL